MTKTNNIFNFSSYNLKCELEKYLKENIKEHENAVGWVILNKKDKFNFDVLPEIELSEALIGIEGITKLLTIKDGNLELTMKTSWGTHELNVKYIPIDLELDYAEAFEGTDEQMAEMNVNLPNVKAK